MTTMTTAPALDSPFLNGVRDTGAAAYERAPMPTRKDEYWRFTRLRGVELDQVPAFVPAGDADQVEFARERTARSLTASTTVAGELLHVNYETVEDSIRTEALPEGVVFTSLATAARDHGDLLARHFGTVVPTGETCDDKFVDLNTANLAGGAFLYVPRNTTVELPFRADVVMTAGGAVNWRALIVLEEGAEATFVEEFLSTDSEAGGFSNAVVELVAGANARLHYVTVQDYAVPVQHFATHRVTADRDAQVQWSAVGLGASMGKSRMEAHLLGEGSNVKLTGAYYVDGQQQIDYDTYQWHKAPNATSDLFFKGVLDDKAHAVWRGMIAVAPGAQGTDSFQNNKNLVLKSGAHADSVPGLQIEANDVRCTHASTTSKVDAEQLFYLQARGITREDAIREIVRGFYADVLARIEVEQVRDQVRDALWQRLEHGLVGR
ncbi:MAG: Fe-S cluster assembly protein SufD [Thermoleophilia bacterium]|nr:Fe-S cluster assembly protein SufD [Thermoleophilia bacterium]